MTHPDKQIQLEVQLQALPAVLRPRASPPPQVEVVPVECWKSHQMKSVENMKQVGVLRCCLEAEYRANQGERSSSGVARNT